MVPREPDQSLAIGRVVLTICIHRHDPRRAEFERAGNARLQCRALSQVDRMAYDLCARRTRYGEGGVSGTIVNDNYERKALAAPCYNRAYAVAFIERWNYDGDRIVFRPTRQFHTPPFVPFGGRVQPAPCGEFPCRAAPPCPR